jgi:hypothetical protein
MRAADGSQASATPALTASELSNQPNKRLHVGTSHKQNAQQVSCPTQPNKRLSSGTSHEQTHGSGLNTLRLLTGHGINGP